MYYSWRWKIEKVNAIGIAHTHCENVYCISTYNNNNNNNAIRMLLLFFFAAVVVVIVYRGRQPTIWSDTYWKIKSRRDSPHLTMHSFSASFNWPWLLLLCSIAGWLIAIHRRHHKKNSSHDSRKQEIFSIEFCVCHLCIAWIIASISTD